MAAVAKQPSWPSRVMGEKMREGREEGQEGRRLDDERKEEEGEKTRGGGIRWWSLLTDCRSRSGQSISAGA